MIRRPPRSTLFPYTTLFRSHRKRFAANGLEFVLGEGRFVAPRTIDVHLAAGGSRRIERSEEHTSELQSPDHLVCRLLLEKKKNSRERQHNNYRHRAQKTLPP